MHPSSRRFSRAGMLAAIMRAARAEPVVDLLSDAFSRASYLERRRRIDLAWPGTTAIRRHGGWSQLLRAVRSALEEGRDLELEHQVELEHPPIDESHWTEGEDTQRFPVVPEGWVEVEVTSRMGRDGEVEGQTIRAQPEGTPGELVPIIPEGLQIDRVTTQQRIYEGRPEIRQQWVKTAPNAEVREALVQRMIATLEDRVTVRSRVIAPPHTGAEARDTLAVYPIGDHHVGMLSWSRETGHRYDLRRAEDLLRGAFDFLTTQGPPATRGIVISLGDFYHSNDLTNRTPRSGHVLDVDGRMAKVFESGVAMLVYGIDRALEAHDNVEVWCVPGNHDPLLTICLAVVLRAHYRGEPRVEVRQPGPAAYVVEWGHCLVAATHGDGAKKAKLPGWLASVYPESWGRTRWRRILRGHEHHEDVHEEGGAVVETFPVLPPVDAYGAKQGYAGTQRNMHRLAFHRARGLSGRTILPVEALDGAP